MTVDSILGELQKAKNQAQEAKSQLQEAKSQLQKAKSQLQKAKNQVQEAKSQLIEEYKKISFTCLKCKKINEVKDVIFVECWYYERPRGCMEGDIWHPSDQRMIFCPSCGTLHKLVSEQSIDRFVKFKNVYESDVYEHIFMLHQNGNFYYFELEKTPDKYCQYLPNELYEEYNGVKLNPKNFLIL